MVWLYYFSIILLKHQLFLVIGFALPRGMHIGEDLSWKEWLFEDVFQCLRIRLILSCRSITFWLQLPPGNLSSACISFVTFYSRYCHHTVFLSTTNSQLCSHIMVAAAGRAKLITSWHQLMCNTCWIGDCSQHHVLLAMALLAKSRFSDYICTSAWNWCQLEWSHLTSCMSTVVNSISAWCCSCAN
jgi:hypothetical protein